MVNKPKAIALALKAGDLRCFIWCGEETDAALFVLLRFMMKAAGPCGSS